LFHPVPSLVEFVSSAIQPAAELRLVFEGLGFYVHPTSFNTAIPDPELRELLSKAYGKSSVSRLLENLPDLFVLHPDMANGIFFVKLGDKLSDAEECAYKQFYPRDILLASMVPQNGKPRRLVCAWVGQTKQQSLLAALKERFGFAASAQMLKAFEKSGWSI
jgi:hypothetical protein